MEKVADEFDLPPTEVQRLLDTIEAKGLVTLTKDRPNRYLAAPPDIALQALSLQHQQALQRAQGTIDELQREALAARPEESEQIIELITDRESGRLLLQQMQQSARHEISVLVRPPVIYTPITTSADGSDQRELRARGVRCRSINDTSILSLPGALDHIRADVNAGEEARMMPSLPFKMVLVDRRIAMIFLNPHQADNPMLLVRYSALLEALYALYEILWQRAVPLAFTTTGTLETRNTCSRLTEQDEELVRLMAIGLNDKTIAHDLRISVRTLERRVSEMMQNLDSRTRFQAGWVAALRLSASNLPIADPLGNAGKEAPPDRN